MFLRHNNSMHNSRFMAGFGAVLLLMATSAYSAGQTTTVQLADLPPAAQKTVHAHLGKGHLTGIEKNVEQGKVTYDVEMKKGNRDRNFTVNDEGELLDVQVFLGETPPPVQAAIRKYVGTSHLENITKQLDDKDISFAVEITQAGQNRTFTVNKNGQLLKRQVFLAEMPMPVQAAVAKESAGRKLGDLSQTFDDGKTDYEVEINPDGKPFTVTIAPDGHIVARSVEVALSETPAAVQNAVKALMQNARLISLTKTTEDGDVTYDVDLKRGDQWESVSLGNDGKIAP